MTPLSHDTARCEGRIVTKLGGFDGMRLNISAGPAECLHCRRREPHTPDPDAPDRLYPHMSPPAFVDGRCPNRIAP